MCMYLALDSILYYFYVLLVKHIMSTRFDKCYIDNIHYYNYCYYQPHKMCLLTDETFIAQHETNILQSSVKYYKYIESCDFLQQVVSVVKIKSQSAL